MTRFFSVFNALAIVGPLTLVLALAAPADAANLPLEDAMVERSIGAEDAPVTVHEYASLSCSHCGAFHRETFPKLKKDYIDTGRVRLVYHDFPIGGLATAAAMLTRCGNPNAYFGFIGVLYENQSVWLRSDTPLMEMERFARMAGMSPDDVAECLDNEPLFKAIEARKASFNKELGVNSTPTFFIGKKKIAGNLAYDDFKELLDAALAGAN